MKMRLLQATLFLVGLFFVAGLYLVMDVLAWPSWTWEPRQAEYEQMIMVVYAVLGIFLLRVSAIPWRIGASSGSPCGRV